MHNQKTSHTVAAHELLISCQDWDVQSLCVLHCSGGQAGAQQPFSNGVLVGVQIAAQASYVDAPLAGGNRQIV